MKDPQRNPQRDERWRQRFYVPTVLWMRSAQLAPGHALVVSNQTGLFELHAIDFTTGSSRQLTRRPGGTLFGSLSPDGTATYFLNDRKGNEYGHFFRVSFSGGTAADITPDLPPYYSYGVSVSDRGDCLVFTASVANAQRVYGLSFNVNGKVSAPHLLYHSMNGLSDALVSPDGTYTLIIEHGNSRTSQLNSILCIENIGKNIRRSESQLRGLLTPLAISRRTAKPLVLAITNRSGYYRPEWLDPSTGNIRQIVRKRFHGDLFVLAWQEDIGILILNNVWQASHRLYRYDLNAHTARPIGPHYGSFDMFFGAVAFLPNDSLLVKWQRFGFPPRIIKLSPPRFGVTKAFSRLASAQPERSLRKIWIRSSDGAKIQMWVAKPDQRRKRQPFVIEVHGGPHGVVSDEFLPEAHAWLDRGFGYCAVNYRGSITFGKDFEEKIYGNPGYWETEDIAAARAWLVARGGADPNSIIITGWSWGGYITLLALGRYPKLWRGGIAGMAIADCATQYEDEPAFFKAIDRKRFGGSPHEVPQRYAQSSPISYARNIRAPVLIIQGKNDARCTPRQIIKFVNVLRKFRKPFTVRWFSAGHVSAFADVKLHTSNLGVALTFASDLVAKKRTPKTLVLGDGDR